MKNKEQAQRNNEGKPQLSYIDLNCLMDVADVFTFGAVKYERDNWKKGQPINKVLDSLERHIAGLQRGEFLDPESGLPHHGHIGCNVIFLANTFMNHPKLIESEVLRKASQEYYTKRVHIPFVKEDSV